MPGRLGHKWDECKYCWLWLPNEAWRKYICSTQLNFPWDYQSYMSFSFLPTSSSQLGQHSVQTRLPRALSSSVLKTPETSQSLWETCSNPFSLYLAGTPFLDFSLLFLTLFSCPSVEPGIRLLVGNFLLSTGRLL